MRKIHLAAAFAVLATPAFADMNAEIDMAKAEAQKAAAATDMELIQLPYQKEKLKDAATTLIAGCNQSKIADAHKHATDAIKTLDKAKAATE